MPSPLENSFQPSSNRAEVSQVAEQNKVCRFGQSGCSLERRGGAEATLPTYRQTPRYRRQARRRCQHRRGDAKRNSHTLRPSSPLAAEARLNARGREAAGRGAPDLLPACITCSAGNGAWPSCWAHRRPARCAGTARDRTPARPAAPHRGDPGGRRPRQRCHGVDPLPLRRGRGGDRHVPLPRPPAPSH